MIWLMVLSILLLVLLYPIRLQLYTEDGIKAALILIGFVRLPINIKKQYRRLVSRSEGKQASDDEPFSIMEVVENTKKLISMAPVSEDLMKHMVVEEFFWYSAIPMDNPLLGLSMLPIYTTAQTFAIDYAYTHFKKIEEYDIDTKYNYLTDELLIYFTSIIRINLLKIMVVSVKYIRKWPLLFKRTT